MSLKTQEIEVNSSGDADLIIKYDNTPEATLRHGYMALVEWSVCDLQNPVVFNDTS